jgi:hypothetical protein
MNKNGKTKPQHGSLNLSLFVNDSQIKTLHVTMYKEKSNNRSELDLTQRYEQNGKTKPQHEPLNLSLFVNDSEIKTLHVTMYKEKSNNRSELALT